MIAAGSAGQHLRDRHGVRHDLGVDLGLPHPAGDQLGVLGAEVDDENRPGSCHATTLTAPPDRSVDPCILSDPNDALAPLARAVGTLSLVTADAPPWPLRPDPLGFTVADLHALPNDGLRYELIDGSIIVSRSATTGHNLIARWIANILDDANPSNEWLVSTDQSTTVDDRSEPRPDLVVCRTKHVSTTPVETVTVCGAAADAGRAGSSDTAMAPIVAAAARVRSRSPTPCSSATLCRLTQRSETPRPTSACTPAPRSRRTGSWSLTTTRAKSRWLSYGSTARDTDTPPITRPRSFRPTTRGRCPLIYRPSLGSGLSS